jgi:hypothetical protein
MAPNDEALLRRVPWDRIEKYSEPEPMSGCLLWIGCLSDSGYALLRVKGKNKRVHRLLWEAERGVLPSSLTLDHLCRVRSCINIRHLEPVSARENTLRGICRSAVNSRKTHCHRGHEFTPENTRIEGLRLRRCRQCRKEQIRPRATLAADRQGQG